MSLSDAERHLATLRTHSQHLAEVLRQRRAEAGKIETYRRASAGQVTPQEIERRAAQMQQNLSESTRAALEQLRQQRDDAADAARRALAKTKPRYETGTLDSAWSRVKPILDHGSTADLYNIMGLVAAQSPEVRAAVRAYLPLYLHGRMAGGDPRQIEETTAGVLKVLRQAEQPHLSEEERAVYAAEDELEQGLTNLQAAENWTRYELETGREQAHLMDWQPRTLVGV